MKKIIITFLTLAAFASQAQEVSIDESAATIKFVFLDDEVEGTISDFKFTGSINLDNLSDAKFNGSVAMETLDTNNWLRNRHLRAKKYFYNSENPRLTFETKSLKGANSGKEFLIYGSFTIKGITKAVTLNVNRSADRFLITGLINTADFGINIHKKAERNMVQIRILLPYAK